MESAVAISASMTTPIPMTDSASTDSRPPRGASGQSWRQSLSNNHKSKRPRDRHALALESIRHFLRGRSSYDVLPVSFRLIVLDTQLVVGPALEVMWGAGVVSAPLWHSNPTSKPSPDKVTANLGIPTATRDDRSQTDDAVEPASAPAAANYPASANSSFAATHANLAGPVSGTAVSRSKPGFAGMLTVNDIIHLIQYYYHHSSYETAKKEVESFRLEGLRDIEARLSVPPPPLLSCHPLRPLYDACQLLMKTHARRLPLLDYDEQTGIETVVSVLTQYRVLKFIAMNCRETASLYRSLRSLGVGTFVASAKVGNSSISGSRRGSEKAEDSGVHTASTSRAGSGLPTPISTKSEDDTPKQEVPQGQPATAAAHVATQQEERPHTTSTTKRAPSQIPRTSTTSSPGSNPHHPIYTATLDTTVFDVAHIFSERGISAVPIIDEEGYAVDMYESVDVITLVRSGAYQSLDLTIRQALERRPPDFPGVYSCSPDESIANIFALLRKKRVHRLLIVESEESPRPSSAGATSPAPASSLALEDELEKSGPRLRKRGKLVGILALSDLLRHIIGLKSKNTSDAAFRAGRKRTSSSETGGSASGISGPTSLSDAAVGMSNAESLVLSPIEADAEALPLTDESFGSRHAEAAGLDSTASQPAGQFGTVCGAIPEEREAGPSGALAGGSTPTVQIKALTDGEGDVSSGTMLGQEGPSGGDYQASSTATAQSDGGSSTKAEDEKGNGSGETEASQGQEIGEQ